MHPNVRLHDRSGYRFASAGREDQLSQVVSLALKGNVNLTLSEGLHQLFGHPLHRLGGDLGPKVAVKWRRCSSLWKTIRMTSLDLGKM